MNQDDLLKHAVDVFERLDIRYFVTGSTASTLFGEARLTKDIDIVAEIRPAVVSAFCRAFPSTEFCISDDAVRYAVAHSGQFNILHPGSGFKIDVMIPSTDVFDRGRLFRAKRHTTAMGFDAVFASPEDVILMKLKFYKEGGSDKHVLDIKGIVKYCRDELDLDYVANWATRMGTMSMWQTIIETLKPNST